MEILRKIEEKKRISFDKKFLGQNIVNVSLKKTKDKSVSSRASIANPFGSVYLSLDESRGVIFLS